MKVEFTNNALARMLEVVFTRDLAETRILTAYWQDLAP